MNYRTSLFCAKCKQAVKEKLIIFTADKLGICPNCYYPTKPC